MIEFTPENLSADSAAKLRKWLNMREADTLRRVINSQCQLAQAEALNKALTAKKGDPSDLLAQDAMREASRYADFIKIFDSIKSTTWLLTVAKLKPHQNYANARPEGSEADTE